MNVTPPEDLTPANLLSISNGEKQWLEAFLDISLSNPPTTMAKAMLHVSRKLAKLECDVERLKETKS